MADAKTKRWRRESAKDWEGLDKLRLVTVECALKELRKRNAPHEKKPRRLRRIARRLKAKLARS